MKEVVFLGSKSIGFRCLHYLADRSAELGVAIVGVCANSGNVLSDSAQFDRFCAERGLPIFGGLDALPACDVLISVQYQHILKTRHIAKARCLAVNLHLAPLPEYRGCNQFSFAIVDGASEFGVTLHCIAEAIDGGDILFEQRFPIVPRCFVKELYDQSTEAGYDLFCRHIADLISGNYTPIPQSVYKGLRASSYHYRNEIDILKQIDPLWPSEKIDRHLRATYFPPYEPPYMFIEGQKWYFAPCKDN